MAVHTTIPLVVWEKANRGYQISKATDEKNWSLFSTYGQEGTSMLNFVCLCDQCLAFKGTFPVESLGTVSSKTWQMSCHHLLFDKDVADTSFRT